MVLLAALPTSEFVGIVVHSSVGVGFVLEAKRIAMAVEAEVVRIGPDRTTLPLDVVAKVGHTEVAVGIRTKAAMAGCFVGEAVRKKLAVTCRPLVVNHKHIGVTRIQEVVGPFP